MMHTEVSHISAYHFLDFDSFLLDKKDSNASMVTAVAFVSWSSAYCLTLFTRSLGRSQVVLTLSSIGNVSVICIAVSCIYSLSYILFAYIQQYSNLIYSMLYIQTMNQLQTIQKENKTLDKARLIAASKRVRRFQTEESRIIWLVGSGNPKTPTRFYRVMLDETTDAFVCDCPYFTYNEEAQTCKHILACAIFEGNSSNGSKA